MARFTVYRLAVVLTFRETSTASQECLDVGLAVFSYKNPIHLSSLHMFSFIFHAARYGVLSGGPNISMFLFFHKLRKTEKRNKINLSCRFFFLC